MASTEETEPAGASTGGLLRAVEAAFAQMWRWGALSFLIAISPGLALWPLVYPSALKYIVRNDLSIGQRHAVLLTMALSFALTSAAYVALWLWRRRAQPQLGLGASIVETNRRAFILVALPMLTALNVPRIEVRHELFTSFLMVAVTALAAVFFYRALGLRRLAPPADPFVPGRHGKIARAGLWAAIAGYAAYFCYYTILDHHNLGTTVYDLGIYDNLVWQTAHGRFLDCTFIKGGNHTSAHFDPILWVVAQVYRVYQSAETLLVLQTLWLAGAALPLWALAMRRLKNEWMALTLVVVYLLYPALHGVNMFDFHSVALIVPLVLWAVYLLDVGALRRYWLVFALLLLCREDISIFNCFLGAYAILIGRTRTGLATIFLSVLYLTCVKMFVMADPSLLMAEDKAYSYVYFYEEMIPHPKEGARGLFTTLLVNPLYALQVVFKQDKLLFFFHLLLPLLALPFAAGRKAVLTIYGLLFIGLASRKNLYSLHFQYSALLFPMLFAALPDGVVRVTESRRLRALGLERARVAWTLMLSMLTASLLVSAKRGAIFDNASFVAGWGPLTKSPSEKVRERYARMQEMIARIGPEAAVAANDETGPHISSRARAYHWPTINDAQYLLLFVESEYFRKDDQRRLDLLVRRGRFRVIDEAHGVQLLERVGAAELDEEFRGETRGQGPGDPHAAPGKAPGRENGGAKGGSLAGEGHGGETGGGAAGSWRPTAPPPSRREAPADGK